MSASHRGSLISYFRIPSWICLPSQSVIPTLSFLEAVCVGKTAVLSSGLTVPLVQDLFVQVSGWKDRVTKMKGLVLCL